VIRSTFDLPAVLRVNDGLVGTPVAVSPLGDIIAYTTTGGGGLRTFIRHLDELAAREILDASNLGLAGRNLAFSPDGRWLAFTESNVLRRVSVEGGQTITVVPALLTAVPYGISWGERDTIFVGSFTGLEAVPAFGGTPIRIGLKDSTSVRVGQRWPLALPGGRAVLYSTGNSTDEIPRLGVLDLGTREVTVHDLQVAVSLGILDGRLVFVSPSGMVMAVAFDLRTLRPTGEAVPMEDGVVVDPTGGAKASLSASGTLVYLKGRAESQPVIVRAGGGEPVPLVREPQIYSTPRYSPDGRRVAITVMSARSSDIWIYDIVRNTFTRLTTEGANIRPEWTPDGKRVLFRSDRGGKVGIWCQPTDGSGPAELLYEPPVEPSEAIVSPDGKWLVFRTAPGATHSRDILAVPMEGERTIVPLLTGPASEMQPRLSPDGKWLVYQSNEGGPYQIYVRPFPGPGARVQVTTAGGTEPIWGRSGTRLYYRDELGQITEVAVTTGPEFSLGERRVVVTGDYLTDASHANWDVSPAGEFLVLKRAGAESQTIVVHNWIRELREKTASRQ
jgi:serine/threonine-protein kinase